jgi:asparagine N-glycosylation enzyme membrane subunit Stt3
MNKKEAAIISAIFVLAFLLFCTPSLIRWSSGNPSIIGGPTYMHQRIAEQMLSGNFNRTDDLSFGGRPYTYPPFFSAGIAFFGLFFPLQLAGLFFVALFGGLATVSFYLTARIFFPKKRPIVAAAVLLLAPGIIFLFSHLDSRAPSMALSLLGLYFLLSGHGKKYYAGGALLGIAGLFHIEVAIVFGIIFLFMAKDDRKIIRSIILALVIAAAWYGPFLAAQGLPQINNLHEEYRERQFSLESPTIGNYFYEISAKGYLTLFLGALAVIGFVKSKSNFLRFWLIFTFIITLAAERFFIYLAFPAALLAASALVWMSGKTKRKNLFAVIIVALLAYSAFFGAVKVWNFAGEYPSREQYEAFTWIKNNTPENAMVFSDWQWGHWVTGIANRKSFIDGYAEYAPNATERVAKMENFYKTCEVPAGYNITYVYMEKWFADARNMTCLSKFELVYDKNWLEIYKV